MVLCRRQVPSDAPTGVLGLVIENIRASIVIWISDFGIARPAGPNLQSGMTLRQESLTVSSGSAGGISQS